MTTPTTPSLSLRLMGDGMKHGLTMRRGSRDPRTVAEIRDMLLIDSTVPEIEARRRLRALLALPSAGEIPQQVRAAIEREVARPIP